MNDHTIELIAEAILANTRILEKLVDTLPVEVKQQVHKKVATVAPAKPVAKEPEPVVEAAPVVAPAPAPVVAAPTVTVTEMPAPPVFTAPAPVAAPAIPFNDGKSLVDYVMGVYRAIGPAKGAGIQNVLTQLGYRNINDVNPAHYAALYAGIEALK